MNTNYFIKLFLQMDATDAATWSTTNRTLRNFYSNNTSGRIIGAANGVGITLNTTSPYGITLLKNPSGTAPGSGTNFRLSSANDEAEPTAMAANEAGAMLQRSTMNHKWDAVIVTMRTVHDSTGGPEVNFYFADQAESPLDGDNPYFRFAQNGDGSFTGVMTWANQQGVGDQGKITCDVGEPTTPLTPGDTMMYGVFYTGYEGVGTNTGVPKSFAYDPTNGFRWGTATVSELPAAAIIANLGNQESGLDWGPAVRIGQNNQQQSVVVGNAIDVRLYGFLYATAPPDLAVFDNLPTAAASLYTDWLNGTRSIPAGWGGVVPDPGTGKMRTQNMRKRLRSPFTQVPRPRIRG